jgi:hypothetical protein
MSADDIREVRQDIKALLTAVAELKTKMEEHGRPCLQFQQHLEEHAKKKGALAWFATSILAPIGTTIVTVWALLRLGLKD